MNDGGTLTETSREILFQIARLLCKSREKRFESPLANGKIVVETRFKTSALATLVGFKFSAIIELTSGKTHRVEYLVSPKDLPRVKRGEVLTGTWVPTSHFGALENN